MEKYEYIIKVDDEGMWLKVKERIYQKCGDIQNLDIHYLPNGSIKLTFESNDFHFNTSEAVDELGDVYKPVILCKDCIYFEEYCRIVDGVASDHVCSLKREIDGNMHRVKANDFCSWAKRKEE